MNGEHIGDLAELYAIGSLDNQLARSVEAHVRSCEHCSQRLAQASMAVTEIESARAGATPPASLDARLRRSIRYVGVTQHRWVVGLAAAAAFAIALLPTWVAVDRTREIAGTLNADEQALARIARAPSVQRATFMAGGHAMGNVLYGKGGDWYYIVVAHPMPRMQVAYVHDGRREMLGTVVPHGTSGTLYVPVDHRMDELALMEGNTVVADAHLVF